MNRIFLPLMTAFIIAVFPVNAQKKEEKKDDKKEEKKEVIIRRGDEIHPGLDLTDEQKKKMKEIHGRTAKETMVLKNQVGEKKAHLKTLMSMDKPDVNDVNKTIDEMQLLKAQILKKEMAGKIESRALLTDEQRMMHADMDFDDDNMHDRMIMMHNGMMMQEGPMMPESPMMPGMPMKKKVIIKKFDDDEDDDSECPRDCCRKKH